MNCIWKKSKIGDVLKVQGGYAFSSESFVDGGVPLVRISNIVNTKIVDRSPVYLPEQYLLEFSNYAGRECDTLIAMSGATTGKTAFVRQIDLPFLINQRVGRFLISDNESITKEYLFYLVSSDEFLNEVLIDSAGGAQPNISSYDIERIEFYRPPLPQQQKIAKILTTVDNLIEQTQALIDKYTTIKQGMMADLFTRGIDLSGTPETNPNHGQLRPSFEEAPELYKDTELGWVPKEWEAQTLRDISHKVTDGSHQSVQTSEDGDVAFLFVSCIRNGKILWDKAALISRDDYSVISKGREPKKGDILYTAVGSYGHAACVENDTDFTFQRHIAYIKPDANIVLSEFLTELLNFESIRRWADRVALGNAQKTVTLGELAKFPITLPTLAEQGALMNCLQQTNSLIDQNARLKQKYCAAKKGLMQDLLTGKVQVTA